jgi:hypothetical protein
MKYRMSTAFNWYTRPSGSQHPRICLPPHQADAFAPVRCDFSVRTYVRFFVKNYTYISYT